MASQAPILRNATAYPDMQDLLQCADVLLTDYSSCMWDFSLMHKPCFLYARDISEYRGERDFYTPIEDWPFPLASNNDELAQVIADFDEDTSHAAVDRHHEELGSTESATAARQCAERIVEFLNPYPKRTRHCEPVRTMAHPRVASLALRAIHLLAIPWIFFSPSIGDPGKLRGLPRRGFAPPRNDVYFHFQP